MHSVFIAESLGAAWPQSDAALMLIASYGRQHNLSSSRGTLCLRGCVVYTTKVIWGIANARHLIAKMILMVAKMHREHLDWTYRRTRCGNRTHVDWHEL